MTNNAKYLPIFLTYRWIIDFVLWIIEPCDLLDYLTFCSIDWCGHICCRRTNCVGCNYSNYITIYLRLSYQFNKRGHSSSFIYFLFHNFLLPQQKETINSTFNIINLLIFVIWIIELHGLLDCFTSRSIDWWVGLQ